MAKYIVTGATGRQGGAVVDLLLAAGHTVHATIRDKSSAKAKALADRGVVLFEGTHEEPAFFETAAAGCTGLFLNISVFDATQAKVQTEAIIKACKAGAGDGLTSIVLSSAFRTSEMNAGIAVIQKITPFIANYYTAKGAAEQAVKDSGIKHMTILRPPLLMYDFLLPVSAMTFPSLPQTGTLTTSLDEGQTFPYLCEGDIAKFAVAAFEQPEKFAGNEIELGAEDLTGEEAARTLSLVAGFEVKHHRRSQEEIEAASRVVFQGFELIQNRMPYHVEPEALERDYGIKLTGFEEYLSQNKEDLMKSLPPLSLASQ